MSNFQKQREIDKAIFSALTVILELYEDKTTDSINSLPTKRKENIEKQMKQLTTERKKIQVDI